MLSTKNAGNPKKRKSTYSDELACKNKKNMKFETAAFATFKLELKTLKKRPVVVLLVFKHQQSKFFEQITYNHTFIKDLRYTFHHFPIFFFLFVVKKIQVKTSGKLAPCR